MALSITQHPLYPLSTVGQEIIFTVAEANLVSTLFNVKYIAEVHIATDTINLATSVPIGTFKTKPNNAGVGMFDFRPIVESYVSADNLAPATSEFKGNSYDNIPAHITDKYSLNENSVRYLKIKFSIEGSTTAGGAVSEQDTEDSDPYTLFNGYLKHTDELDLFNGSFGYDTVKFYLNEFVFPGDVVGEYLTNAPLTQYANDTDYGTISFISTEAGTDGILARMKVKYYNSSGTEIGTEDDIPNNDANGGFTTFTTETKNQLISFGCYPANLRNWSTNFANVLSLGTLAYYRVYAENAAGYKITETLTINVNCPTLKGYEPIRLTWLNQWGTWDYYTFTMKSAKTISTKGSTYQQLSGTWNDSLYQVNGFKGGKKAFRVNATEKISMNTAFVSEAESEWFEELINSPEVYILEGYQSDVSFPALNNYAIPVRLTTSNYTKKTVANDKLMQYTFEVEKSKTLRTQSI